MKYWYAFMCCLGFHDWEDSWVDDGDGQEGYFFNCRHCGKIDDWEGV